MDRSYGTSSSHLLLAPPLPHLPQGCILFDESHKAKHLFPEADADGSGAQGGGRARAPNKGKSTKMALAVQQLQARRRPRAQCTAHTVRLPSVHCC